MVSQWILSHLYSKVVFICGRASKPQFLRRNNVTHSLQCSKGDWQSLPEQELFIPLANLQDTTTANCVNTMVTKSRNWHHTYVINYRTCKGTIYNNLFRHITDDIRLWAKNLRVLSNVQSFHNSLVRLDTLWDTCPLVLHHCVVTGLCSTVS